MTDDNQNAVDNGTEVTPQFGSDQDHLNVEPQFNQEDVSKMLKQNVNGQEHIKTLEAETATLRDEVRQLQQDLSNAKSIDDLMSEIRHDNIDSNPLGTTSPQLDVDKLKAELTEEVTATFSYREQQAAEEANISAVTDVLKEKHGDEYATYVDVRARELGMDNAEITNLARTKPQVFMELVSPGTPTPRSAPSTPAGSTPQGSATDIESVEYARIARLRKMNTEDGAEAVRLWNDPDWQHKHRVRILDKAKSEGRL